MNPTTPNLRLIYLAAIVMCVVLSLTGARGDDKPVPPLKVAVVNPGKLLDEYKYTVESSEKFEKKKADILTEISSWDQNRLLSEGDQHILGAIVVKESDKIELTVAEKTTKQKLQDAHKHLFDEYLALQQKQMPTREEEARLKDLSHMEVETGRRVKERQASAQKELQQQAEDAQIKMNKDVHDGIVKVAKAKGFNLVFSSQVVFYCENDLTDEVLKDINSH